ncbi:MAG: DUF5623 domain-containing protein [Gammaproteobacteria bacterium]|nr:DUF5623 domain-containing protein [Gammaproteobacteria bacterium]
MPKEDIRPSSLGGIKRLAKSLKAERGIQHMRALDEAALLAGFQNFRHASQALRNDAKPERPSSGYKTFITVYWEDRKTGNSGRETLSIMLSQQWSDLITPPQLKNHRALFHFRPEGPDHLARHYLVESQSKARRATCAATRILQFMDATKLRPSKSHSRVYPGGRSSNAIPGRDHYSAWYDRDTKRYLFVDEPYEAAANSNAAKRTAWAQRHGYVIAKPTWAGMYNPNGGSRLYLIANMKKGIPLEPIVMALDRLPAPVVETPWVGESAPAVPFFVSPGAVAEAKAKKLEQKKPRQTNGQCNSIGYVQTFAGPRRRPKGKMSIEAHAEVGSLLKTVLVASPRRKGVYNRVNSIRSELDEWTQCEYNYGELPSERFFELYYHESSSTFPRYLSADERRRHIDSLERVKQILSSHYPDCPPLRSLIGKINSAIKSMQTWVS